ncbi:hypothetical protein CLIM01_03942 [Colletotrichum limetticola]|uniref:Uncharacterized protein n=1 Tax=Colletotrichum limetticola TaxID=1209924 RepID=A0ABQ9Q4I1_9PEZI|nr:hypothetical protein CLIM01_03942 [Colletotrichum limetticola]
MGERTGSRVFQWVWSYVVVRGHRVSHQAHTESSSAWGIALDYETLLVQGEVNDKMGKEMKAESI